MRFFVLSLLLIACGGNKSKKDDGGGGPVVITEPTEVENDGITTIDTRERGETRVLSFITSGNEQFGRYLSEYLLVVKATEDSCVRLKVRPAEAIDSPLADDKFENTDPDAQACQGPQGGGDSDETDDQSEDTNTANNEEDNEDRSAETEDNNQEEQQTNLRATTSRKIRNIAIPMRDDHRAYLDTVVPTIDNNARRNDTFSITSTPAVCSLSIFRMSTTRLSQQPDIEGNSLDATVTKTGRLLVVSKNKKVRVWVDEEYGNPCVAVGQTPDDFTAIAFDPEVRASRTISIDFNEESNQPEVSTEVIWDKLFMEHLQNLADESEKAHNRLTTAFGPVSDVDGNGSVDIFLSPDVNREYFFSAATIPRPIDDFRIPLIYKPNDLAPYNSQTNSASNEGEIIYLWVPDPAGIYTYDYFSSANSLTTNYAKGFIASQLMTMIILNHKLIVDGRNADEQRWMIDMLAMLAASYIGGNDFVFQPLVQYLTARTHTVNLFPEGTVHETPDITDDERQGLQLMFAWYLHSRLCGKKITICEKLKSLIDTELTGEANLENTFGVDVDQLMLNFGISVGAQISDDPTVVRKLWAASNTSLEVPIELPEFDRTNPASSIETEVSPSDPPLTVELGNDGRSFCTPNPQADRSQNPNDWQGQKRSTCNDGTPPGGANARDPTHATPFPNIDNLIYQVIMPDNDIDLQVGANSVSYILLTGLTSATTDMIGSFGRGLQVVVLPLGDRDPTLRKVYHEKRAEFAPMDTTPINLTDALVDQQAKDIAQQTRTYYQDPPFPQDTMHEWTLRNQKELWLTGSIDTFDVNGVSGISDSDTYNIKVDVAEPSLVIVQTKIRDIDEQLKPFIVVTTPEARLFKGRAIWAKYDELEKDSEEGDSEEEEEEENENTVKVLCQSASSWGVGRADQCANGGLGPNEYRERRTSNDQTDQLRDWLADRWIPSEQIYPQLIEAVTFDATNNSFGWGGNNGSQNYGFNHIFDNFLFAARKYSHPNRFNNTVFSDSEESEEEEEGTIVIEHRKFSQEMANRQWFNFAYDKKLKATTYEFYAAHKDITFGEGIKRADWDEFKKNFENALGDGNSENTIEQMQEKCSEFGITCDDINNSSDFFRLIPTKEKQIKFIENMEVTSRPVQTLKTYYDPVFLKDKTGVCGGGDKDTTGEPYQSKCSINQPVMRTEDIRRQLNVGAERVLGKGCMGYRIDLFTGETEPFVLGKHYDVCLDSTVTSMDGEDPENTLVYTPIPRRLDSDRQRERCSPLDNRRGEIVGKSNNINYTMFYVPAGESIFNLIIGGTGGSSGKYMTRIKLFGEAGKCQ